MSTAAEEPGRLLEPTYYMVVSAKLSQQRRRASHDILSALLWSDRRGALAHLMDRAEKLAADVNRQPGETLWLWLGEYWPSLRHSAESEVDDAPGGLEHALHTVARLIFRGEEASAMFGRPQ